jgi:hypothetical protein
MITSALQQQLAMDREGQVGEVSVYDFLRVC